MKSKSSLYYSIVSKFGNNPRFADFNSNTNLWIKCILNRFNDLTDKWINLRNICDKKKSIKMKKRYSLRFNMCIKSIFKI